jgi:hypothetical protein
MRHSAFQLEDEIPAAGSRSHFIDSGSGILPLI